MFRKRIDVNTVLNMTKTTTPRITNSCKNCRRKRVMTGKYLMEERKKKLMEHRRKTNEKNKIKKQLSTQRNLIKELRKSLK